MIVKLPNHEITEQFITYDNEYHPEPRGEEHLNRNVEPILNLNWKQIYVQQQMQLEETNSVVQ